MNVLEVFQLIPYIETGDGNEEEKKSGRDRKKR